MKLKKKLALVMATVATITSIGATTVLASSSDTEWAIAGKGSSRMSGPRAKEDTTSAWGLTYRGGNDGASDYISMQLKKDYYGNDLVGTYRVLPPVTWNGAGSRYIPSNAYENGYREVWMNIRRLPLSSERYVNGKWSPDSI